MTFDLASVAFIIIAVVLVGSALAVVLLRNIVHSALFLALFFGAAAGIYVLLNAEFIAIVQVLIYAGAVTILVLFAIMLTAHAMSREANPYARQWVLVALIALALGAGIVYAISTSSMNLIADANAPAQLVSAGAQGGTVVTIGQLLYSPFNYSYVLPFEIASVVLLVAIVGAIIIGREE